MSSPESILLFSGNSNPQLSQCIANHLNISIGESTVSKFSDGEILVQIEENVRNRHVFVVQSLSTPVNDHLMELLIIVDALKRASAFSITAVVPYMGYSRQDRRTHSSRVPISAKLTAKMIETAGVDCVLTVDLHADQIQGFFDIPTDNIYSSPVLLGDIWRSHYENMIIVSPDVGGVIRARAIAKMLDDADLAIIDKRRPHPNTSEVLNIIGDVSGKNCVIIDDLVDTAGTLCNAANALKEHGAKQVIAYCTHPVLSGCAIQNIERSVLDCLVVTDTIPLSKASVACPKIRQLSVGEMMAESIRRMHHGESLSSMFTE